MLGTPWAPSWMCARRMGATRTSSTQRTHGGTGARRPGPFLPRCHQATGTDPHPTVGSRCAGCSGTAQSCPGTAPGTCPAAPQPPWCQAATAHASHTRKPQGNPQGLSDTFARRVSADGRNFHIGPDIWLREMRSSLISLRVFPYCTKPALSAAPGSSAGSLPFCSPAPPAPGRTAGWS